MFTIVSVVGQCLVLNTTHAATLVFLVGARAEVERRHTDKVSGLQSGSRLIPQEIQPPERNLEVLVDNSKVHVHNIIKMLQTTWPVKECKCHKVSEVLSPKPRYEMASQ